MRSGVHQASTDRGHNQCASDTLLDADDQILLSSNPLRFSKILGFGSRRRKKVWVGAKLGKNHGAADPL